MKKLLGIVVLGLILVGCAPVTKTHTSSDQYLARMAILKDKNKSFSDVTFKNILRMIDAGGSTKKEALDEAYNLCESLKESPKNGCELFFVLGGPKKTRVISSSSTSSYKSKIDPSVWNDLLGISQGLLGGKSTTESLSGTSSSSSSLSCFKKSESVSGFNKICIYNCMGSDTAINLKSTQICPMSIKN